MQRGTALTYEPSNVYESLYRPYVRRLTYFAPAITHRPYQNFSVFPSPGTRNPGFSFSAEDRARFAVLAFDRLPNKDMFLPNAGQTVCLWRWDEDGNRIDNITDWSLAEFRKHYQPGRGRKAQPVTKEAIFHYVYAVLHDPVYREKYAQNLKREFPRIPLHGDDEAAFWQWAGWGEALMALHIGYETVEPFALRRTEVPDTKVRAAGQSPKAMLKADRDTGFITLDSETTLAGVPPEAWTYRLGNRSALEWVLDQYKERKPKDPTIRAKFDTYRFADHKEHVIDLLCRVTTVSVETVRIVEAMREGR